MTTIYTQNDNFNYFEWNICHFVHFLNTEYEDLFHRIHVRIPKLRISKSYEFLANKNKVCKSVLFIYYCSFVRNNLIDWKIPEKFVGYPVNICSK